MNVEESRSLGRIEAKQDMILDKLDLHMADDKAAFYDHEKRVRDLEKTKWRQQGLTALVAGAVSTAVAYFIRGSMT